MQGENLKGSTFVPMLVSIPKTAIIADSPDQFRHKLRLPRFAKPSYYELRFHPDLVSYTFSGVVAITVDIIHTTRFLVINVVDLTIDHASIDFKVYNVASSFKGKIISQKMLQSSQHIINLILMVSWCPVLQDLAPTEVVFFKDDQIMVLGFGKELPLGEGVLRMNFNGTLNDDLRGFYRRYELFITFNFLDISNKILIMHAENRNA
jgi:puromycin-sensitive aminopeptidase